MEAAKSNDRGSKKERAIARFLQQPGAKEAVCRLSAAGCDRELLVRMVLDVSFLIAFYHAPPAFLRKFPKIESHLPKRTEITKLCADIEQLALRIERLNGHSVVSPLVVLDVVTLPRSPQTENAFRCHVSTYRAVPLVLRAYCLFKRPPTPFTSRSRGVSDA